MEMGAVKKGNVGKKVGKEKYKRINQIKTNAKEREFSSRCAFHIPYNLEEFQGTGERKRSNDRE